MSLVFRRLSCAALVGLAVSGCAEADRLIAIQLEGGANEAPTTGDEGGTGWGITKGSEVLLSNAGLTSVVLGGYANGESYQQSGIVSYQGYQYAAFWNNKRHVVLARHQLPRGAWSTIEFTDYTNSAVAAADTISIGICPTDGTIHLSFDNDRVGELHYRKSVADLATPGSLVAFSVASFSKVTNEIVPGTAISQGASYPRFVGVPGGKIMLELSITDANSGSDEYLWEYAGDTHAWTSLGRFIAGIGDVVAIYIHGLTYSRNGSRLHVAWCWRDSVDASTNYDLLYAYSDDRGRTWHSGNGDLVATSGVSAMTKKSSGIRAWAINANRGLINQEHMTVDEAGNVHVLLSHMPDAESDDASFASARTKSEYFHYLRASSGTWKRIPLKLKSVANFRGKLAISSSGNAYAVLPDLRIAAASASLGFTDWTLIDDTAAGRFFSDPLIDSARLLSEDELSVFYPEKDSPNLDVIDYAIR